jgi:hypothetical protein
MLTASQQHAIDQFAKGLLALGDDALIDVAITPPWYSFRRIQPN